MFKGQDEVEHRENTLLDFAGVTCTADEYHFLAEVDDCEIALPGSIDSRVGLKAGGVENGPVRRKRSQFLSRQPEKHVVGKLGAPGIFGHEPDAKLVVFMSTGGGIFDIDVLVVKIVEYFFLEL